MEWLVFLADGTTRDSRTCRWADVPDRILVVRWWDGPRKGIHWGDSLYGDPSTWKAGEIVTDEAFRQAMERARGHRHPPA